MTYSEWLISDKINSFVVCFSSYWNKYKNDWKEIVLELALEEIKG